VDYADVLALSIGRWMPGLSSLTIVTNTKDRATVELARDVAAEYDYGRVKLHITDVFYEGGAHFNKGAAMEQARRVLMPWEDWVLFIDADVVPQRDWKAVVEAARPEPGNIYGCHRLNAKDHTWLDNPLCSVIRDDRVGYGYFQLFHSTDPRVQKTPLLDTDWTHAGNYDSTLLLMWPTAVEIPVRLWHLGGPNHNWFGKGKDELFQAMEKERIRRGGGWPSIEGERIPKS
jgi:hypothetical protein